MKGVSCGFKKRKQAGQILARLFIRLQLYYVRGLGALGPFDDIEAHCLTFSQRFEALVLNIAVMNKNVSSAVFSAYEAEALGLVEPLNGSFCHVRIPPFPLFEGKGGMPTKKPQSESLCGCMQQELPKLHSDNYPT